MSKRENVDCYVMTFPPRRSDCDRKSLFQGKCGLGCDHAKAVLERSVAGATPNNVRFWTGDRGDTAGVTVKETGPDGEILFRRTEITRGIKISFDSTE